MIFIMTLLVIIFTDCRDDRLSIFGWTPVGETFDSITLCMERDYANFKQPAILLKHIDMMDSIASAAATDTSKIMKSRTLFWRSRFAMRYGSAETSHNLVHQAMALTDSAEMPYDWLRMKTQLLSVSNSINGSERYLHYEECLSYARKINDKAFESQISILMGHLLSNVQEYDKALDFYHLADSLNTSIGLDKYTVKNRINVAATLEQAGQLKESDSILNSLRGHPALEGDTFVQNLIPRNLYSHHRNDISHLREAFGQIKDNPRFRHLRGLYSGLFVEYFYNHSQFDSMLYYSQLANEDISYIRDHGHRAIVWFNMGLAMTYIGNLDSALYCRIMYDVNVDSLRRFERSNEVIRLNALDEIRKRESELSLNITRRNWLIAFLTLVIIGVITVYALLQNRRRMRIKISYIAHELELEKAKRKMAATAITIQEKDAMLSSLRQELAELRKEGVIREGSARRLEASIQTHLSGHEQEETFHEMFDAVNPGFTQRLRKLCPELADSYVKLACYILMELDNKKIATLMMIKPESVRQARWRLRQRLAVPDSSTLEEWLRHLNTEPS